VFKAVLFDCDGVLVDSEPITLRVLTQCLCDSGWKLDVNECSKYFLGRAVRDQAQLFLERTGKPLTEGWMSDFRAKRDQALDQELVVVPGAYDLVENIYPLLGANIACASGADRAKVDFQLRKVGLFKWFEGRIFSGHEMPKTKPAPDVYLAATKYLNVDPVDCLVIEDTPSGVSAGVAAGATVWAYYPQSSVDRVCESELINAGAKKIFKNMHEIQTLLIVLIAK
jgi:HAD superfamily hydrolase (TIGR01509 family)